MYLQYLSTGSPFQCQISSPARVVDVESLEKVSVGALCEFSVESPSAPTAEVLGLLNFIIYILTNLKHFLANCTFYICQNQLVILLHTNTI